jgi:hypothetical protein
MPTGTGAVNLRNLPNVAYKVNPPEFFALTERNVFSPVNLGIGAPSNFVMQQLLQVGVVSQIRLLVLGTAQMVVGGGGTGTAVSTFKWPYGIFYNVQVSGNGMNNFIAASGYDLYLRQIAQNRAFAGGGGSASVDPYTFLNGLTRGGVGVTNALSTTTNYRFHIQLIVPIAMDDTSLVGSLYAQSEATNLTLTLTTEAIANLFTLTGAGAPTMSFLNYAATAATVPVVYLSETFFEVPYAKGASDTLVIPDLTVLHGYTANNNPTASQSQIVSPLQRINGQLERLAFYLDNAAVSTTPHAGTVLPGLLPNYSNAAGFPAQYGVPAFQLIYGGQQTPYTFVLSDLLQIKNLEDYRVLLDDGTYILDLISENPARDQLLLEGVTNLRLVINLGTGIVLNAGAKVHFVQETLFA